MSIAFDIAAAFPLSGQGRPPKRMFSELNTLPRCASANASRRRLLVATHHLRPRRLASRPYLVRLLHPQPLPGLRRRTPTPFLILGHLRQSPTFAFAPIAAEGKSRQSLPNWGDASLIPEFNSKPREPNVPEAFKKPFYP